MNTTFPINPLASLSSLPWGFRLYWRDKHVGDDFSICLSLLQLSVLSRDSVSFPCVYCVRTALLLFCASTLSPPATYQMQNYVCEVSSNVLRYVDI